MRWITRERPKIDRLACPWLIKRFIDPQAEIIYVPLRDVLRKAKELDAIPFDIPDVEFTHYEDKCTFDYFLEKYKLDDPALLAMAPIVRGADTDAHHLAGQSAGLWAISAGLAFNYKDDNDCWNSLPSFMMPCIAGQSICRTFAIRRTRQTISCSRCITAISGIRRRRRKHQNDTARFQLSFRLADNKNGSYYCY